MKTYINPKIEVIEIKIADIITTSPTLGTETTPMDDLDITIS